MDLSDPNPTATITTDPSQAVRLLTTLFDENDLVLFRPIETWNSTTRPTLKTRGYSQRRWRFMTLGSILACPAATTSSRIWRETQDSTCSIWENTFARATSMVPRSVRMMGLRIVFAVGAT